MKRLNSSKDDNIPIYIFILLFTIFFLSFAGSSWPLSSGWKRVKLADNS